MQTKTKNWFWVPRPLKAACQQCLRKCLKRTLVESLASKWNKNIRHHQTKNIRIKVHAYHLCPSKLAGYPRISLKEEKKNSKGGTLLENHFYMSSIFPFANYKLYNVLLRYLLIVFAPSKLAFANRLDIRTSAY